jgi:subtilisin family serine protease
MRIRVRRRTAAGLLSAGIVAAIAGVPGFAHAGTTTLSASSVRLIVGYKHGGNPATAAAVMHTFGARSSAAQGPLGDIGAQTLQVPASSSAAMMAQLRQDPNVSYVEVDHVVKKADVTPDDPNWNLQTELPEVNLPAAWQTTTGSSSVKIAVVDTGVTANPDLAGAVSGGYDYVNNDRSPTDDEGHGTMVASLIAARGDNEKGIAGVCWQCTIMPLKVLDSNGEGYDSAVAKGIIYAANQGAQVINLSLGGSTSSSVLADAVAYAAYRNVLVVAAAGNEGSSKRSYPAAYSDVLAVGAIETGTGNRASYSNFNSSTDHWVDVAAPGTVTSLDQSGNVVYDIDENGNVVPRVQGTSFSSPIVAGIGGLLKAQHPSWTGWSLQHAIEQSSTANGWTTHGEVNAAAALGQNIADVTPPTITGTSPAQNAKVHGTITITPSGLGDSQSGVGHVSLYVNGVYKSYDRTSPFSLSYNTAGLNGTLKLELRVYDKAGNGKVYDRTVLADNTAPSVKITKAPKNKSKISGTVNIYYTGSDKNGVKKYDLLINGKVVRTHTSTAHFLFSAKSYPKNITVQVRAYDNAGNVKYSTKYSYHR